MCCEIGSKFVLIDSRETSKGTFREILLLPRQNSRRENERLWMEGSLLERPSCSNGCGMLASSERHS